MTAIEYRRRADLCRKAAEECGDPKMAVIWFHHYRRLQAMALRAERGWPQ